MNNSIYLTGKQLYGDNFTIEQIRNWYDQEAEAYADLGSKEEHTYSYGYHELNKLYGYKYLKNQSRLNVLGIGAAWGHEFLPIVERIQNLHIIEPSENLRSQRLENIIPLYTKPEIDGTIMAENNTYDLVTSFGTLHHIPNVTHVLTEMIRTTKVGGYLLIREPIISMGDWTKQRPGLTKNERGIPLQHFRKIFNHQNVEIVSENLFFCMTPFLQRMWSKVSKTPIHHYKSYIHLDKWLSKLFAYNVHYHACNKWQRIAPQSVYYVRRKK